MEKLCTSLDANGYPCRMRAGHNMGVVDLPEYHGSYLFEKPVIRSFITLIPGPQPRRRWGVFGGSHVRSKSFDSWEEAVGFVMAELLIGLGV